MTTQLIKKWIEENPQSSHSFYVDVVYNFYMNNTDNEKLRLGVWKELILGFIIILNQYGYSLRRISNMN